MNAGSGLALVAVPPPWNVPLNRGVLWTVLFLALTKRKAKVGRYFGPLREEPNTAATDFARCVPRPPVLQSGAGGPALLHAASPARGGVPGEVPGDDARGGALLGLRGRVLTRKAICLTAQ